MRQLVVTIEILTTIETYFAAVETWPAKHEKFCLNETKNSLVT